MGDAGSMESGDPRVREQDRMNQSSAYILDKGGEMRYTNHYDLRGCVVTRAI